ncbi:MAG: GNAT family N-acetyltransferase [Pseudomonadota bacterium]
MKIDVTNDIAACRALRRTVFVLEQGVSEADEIDDLDVVAIHVLARAAHRPVGTARIVLKNDTAKIGRVCVLKDHRGTGLGIALMQRTLSVAAQQPGIRRAVLGAQNHALAFYERLGFLAFGEVYEDAGIPHRDMQYVF